MAGFTLKRSGDGVQRPIITEPWPGIVSDHPEGVSVVPPNAAKDSLNFMVKHGMLINRPRLSSCATPPDGLPPLAGTTFKDLLNNYHTFIATQGNAYALTAGASPLSFNYNLLGSITSTQPFPYTLASMFRRVYFSNGGNPISYVDGGSTILDASANAGARFLSVIGNHLVAAYTTEPEPGVATSQDFPYRVRWSDASNPNIWAINVNTSAGYIDLLDVKDDITGLFAVGRNGVILRSNGVSYLIPTGNSQSPFYLDNLTATPQGVGSIHPYSLSTYKTMAVFVGLDDVYQFDGSGFNGLGGNCTKALFDDLSNVSGGYVLGTIIPNFNFGFEYLCYLLSIPGPDSLWCYSFKDQSWVRLVYPNTFFTFLSSLAVN